jgi:hypothetical protein
MESNVFAECESLENINIPDGTIQIARRAFSGCFKLKYLKIPASVIDIDEFAFCGCKNLTIERMLDKDSSVIIPPRF